MPSLRPFLRTKFFAISPPLGLERESGRSRCTHMSIRTAAKVPKINFKIQSKLSQRCTEKCQKDRRPKRDDLEKGVRIAKLPPPITNLDCLAVYSTIRSKCGAIRGHLGHTGCGSITNGLLFSGGPTESTIKLHCCHSLATTL